MDHEEAVDTLAAERYLLGEMSEREREAFEEHFFACTSCGEEMRAAAAMREGVKRGDIRQVRPVAPRRAWRPAIAIPWAAAASLAIVAGYESMQPRPGAVGGPIALTPVTLRATTRGAEPVVVPGPGGVVTLAVDAAGADGDRIRYDLKRTDGSVVASGEVAAPSAGVPLLLMVPAGLLNQSERYVLVLQNPRNAGLTAEEYRFRVGSS